MLILIIVLHGQAYKLETKKHALRNNTFLGVGLGWVGWVGLGWGGVGVGV